MLVASMLVRRESMDSGHSGVGSRVTGICWMLAFLDSKRMLVAHPEGGG